MRAGIKRRKLVRERGGRCRRKRRRQQMVEGEEKEAGSDWGC